MSSLAGLRHTRALDRAKLLAAIRIVATTHGAVVEEFNHGRYSHLTIRLRGSLASIGVDGASRIDPPMISWVAPHGPGQCFSRSFEVAVGSRPGANPHHKATSDDWDGLIADLDEGLALIGADEALTFFVHPWAADTAWTAAGSPEPKAAWITAYRATGQGPSLQEAA